jgi:hypothetical protein
MKVFLIAWSIILSVNFNSRGQSKLQDASEYPERQIWVALGPQMTTAEQNDFLIGPYISGNYLFKNNFMMSITAYASLNTGIQLWELPEHAVISTANVCIMPGYRLSVKKGIALQFSSGICYGRLRYIGNSYRESTPGFGPDRTTYDEDIFNYVGLPIKLSFNHFNKTSGVELYSLLNVHRRHELTFGCNLMIGNLRKNDK